MKSETNHTAKSRVAEIRAGLAERRAVAHNNFRKLEEALTSDLVSANSRNAELQAMLARIRINSPLVVHGEATRIHASGLPEHLILA